MISIFVGVSNTLSYANYNFEEIQIDIDNIKPFSDTEKVLGNIIEFNNIYVPYILFIIYIIIQFILFKKYKKMNISVATNGIIILLLVTYNLFISNFNDISFTNINLNNFTVAEVLNVIINPLILIVGVIYQIRTVKKYNEENKKKIYKSVNFFIIVQSVVLILLLCLMNKGFFKKEYIFGNRSPKIKVVEVDWAFGRNINKKEYNIKIEKGKNIDIGTNFKILDIDNEGVFIEYTINDYVKESWENDSYETEIVKQKLFWNTNYKYNNNFYNDDDRGSIDVDGGTRYYIRLEK